MNNQDVAIFTHLYTFTMFMFVFVRVCGGQKRLHVCIIYLQWCFIMAAIENVMVISLIAVLYSIYITQGLA